MIEVLGERFWLWEDAGAAPQFVVRRWTMFWIVKKVSCMVGCARSPLCGGHVDIVVDSQDWSV